MSCPSALAPTPQNSSGGAQFIDLAVSGADLYIGAGVTLGYYSNSSLDDVRINSRALTDTEVALLAASPACP